MKRRPWWSEFRHWVVALVGGLLLLNGSSAALAAGQKASGKAGNAKKAVKSAKSPRHARPTASDIGQAEILEADTVGLRGQASFYGQGFHGRKTATGERFDSRQFTAASNRFPLGTMVAVRRLDDDRCAIVKVNDRMHAKHRRRIIDVSHGVAEYLGMLRAGVVMVRVAPLRAGWQQRGLGACQTAFEAEPVCASCAAETEGHGQPGKLPDFLNMESRSD